MRLSFPLIWLAAIMIHLPASAQEYEVTLRERSSDDSFGISIVPLSKKPPEPLILPSIDSTGALFTELFSLQTKGDAIVSVMVLPESGGEWIYADLNNDQDLTNDGEPVFFAAHENEIELWLNATSDPLRQVGRVLFRTPPSVLGIPEREANFRERLIDENGNLKPPLMQQPRLPKDFTGRKGTYYFPGRLSFRRGQVSLGGELYDVGVYDYGEDGRFDGDEDLLYIDLNQDHLLSISWSTEVFKLNDVFEVGRLRYKLSYVEPYGRSIRIVSTSDEVTNFYEAELAAKLPPGTPGMLDRSFWELELESTSGESIRLADFRGRTLLLNFWGEWCVPCIQEMPSLVAAYEEIPREKLQVIGMLLTYDQAAAEKIIAEHRIRWPQVILTEELQDRFSLNSYPTNFLVYPDGAMYLRMGSVNEEYIRREANR